MFRKKQKIFYPKIQILAGKAKLVINWFKSYRIVLILITKKNISIFVSSLGRRILKNGRTYNNVT